MYEVLIWSEVDQRWMAASGRCSMQEAVQHYLRLKDSGDVRPMYIIAAR